MARTILASLLAVVLVVMVGCKPDSGKGMIVSRAQKQGLTGGMVPVSKAGEMDLIEEIASNRQAYRHGLELLIDFYERAGNNMKKNWAMKELAELDAIPQYRYVIDAEITGPNLRATESISAADMLYSEGMKYKKQGNKLLILRDKDMLRLAMDKFNELIRKYPTSDKIDDAAYHAATIYEYFKDYSIAVTYYERSFQWNSATSYPGRYKAAYIYDDYFHNRQKALELYKEAVKNTASGEHEDWREYALMRIEKLGGGDTEGRLD